MDSSTVSNIRPAPDAILVELADYVAKLDELDSYSRMFFVYHSGKAETDDERVIVIGPEKLAEMAVDAGLATWLVRKVS